LADSNIFSTSCGASNAARILLKSTCYAALLVGASAAQAQEKIELAAADSADRIIVTGTRRAERTVAESSVPVDVVSANDLSSSTPSPDLNDKLARLIPSFNVQRLPTYDGAAFVRPATLRGLSPDQTLVLINGKRRHRSAYISTPQHGEQAVDLAQIPQIALSRIEVLRDGASPCRGSHPQSCRHGNPVQGYARLQQVRVVRAETQGAVRLGEAADRTCYREPA